MSASKPAYRSGLFHANSGGSAFDCPHKLAYEPVERELWFSGYTAGLRQRRLSVSGCDAGERIFAPQPRGNTRSRSPFSN